MDTIPNKVPDRKTRFWWEGPLAPVLLFHLPPVGSSTYTAIWYLESLLQNLIPPTSVSDLSSPVYLLYNTSTSTFFLFRVLSTTFVISTHRILGHVSRRMVVPRCVRRVLYVCQIAFSLSFFLNLRNTVRVRLLLKQFYCNYGTVLLRTYIHSTSCSF